MHLDMDAFFAAVEQRERPELRGKPVIIGHPGRRGVVATCSYEARRFGVRSAMPSLVATRLCPDAVWVSGRMGLYRDVSREVFSLLAADVPVVEQVSVDEAYGDLTEAVGSLDEAVRFVRGLMKAIRKQQHLTASVGLSHCRFLAKIASDMRKPDGLMVIPKERTQEIIRPLSVRVIPGVGPKLGDRLGSRGIETIGDIARASEKHLRELVGTRTALFLRKRARGEDDRPIGVPRQRKQVSEERTYSVDLIDEAQIERELLARAEGVAADLRKRGRLGRTVVLKARDGRYRTVTRSKTLDQPTELADEIFHVAVELWKQRVNFSQSGVRLLGVGVKDLVSPDEINATLFTDERRERLRSMARAADSVRDKFGRGALRPARLIRAQEQKRVDKGGPSVVPSEPAASREHRNVEPEILPRDDPRSGRGAGDERRVGKHGKIDPHPS